MAIPVLPAIAIGVSAASQIYGSIKGDKAAEERAKALRHNALTRLTAAYSGLSEKDRLALAQAGQEERLARQESAALAARAKAIAAGGGVSGGEQVADVDMGLSQFLGSLDFNLKQVRDEIRRQRRLAALSYRSEIIAANAGVQTDVLGDFLNFATVGTQAAAQFSSLAKSDTD
jgi:hypothetical protein